MVLIKSFTTNLRIVESELLFAKFTKLMSQILIKPQYLGCDQRIYKYLNNIGDVTCISLKHSDSYVNKFLSRIIRS